MAVSKVILNGTTLIDVTNDTVASSNLLSGKTATGADGEKVSGGITAKTSSDLTASGATVTVLAGYYASNASKSVATATHANPTASINSTTGVVTASHTQTAGYVSAGTTTGTLELSTQAAKTVTPTESEQTAVAAGKYTTGAVKVGAISKTYVGSDITQRSGTDLSASGATVTVPAGYYASQATKSVSSMTLPTSTASSATSGFTSKATVSRSTADQYINIPTGYNASGAYYKVNAVPNGSVTAPSSISGTSATVSTGTNTLTLTKSVSVTPNVTTAGYISGGTAGNASVSLTASVTTQAAKTVTPTESEQTAVAANTYTTGAVKVGAISKTYVGSGVTQRNNDSLIASGLTVTAPAGYYASAATKTVTPSLQSKTATLSTTDATITADSGYDGLSSVTVPAMRLTDKTVTLSDTTQVVTPEVETFSQKVEATDKSQSFEKNIYNFNNGKYRIIGTVRTRPDNTYYHFDAVIDYQGKTTSYYNSKESNECSLRFLKSGSLTVLGVYAPQYNQSDEELVFDVDLSIYSVESYDGLSSVTVPAMRLQAKAAQPSTTDVVVTPDGASSTVVGTVTRTGYPSSPISQHQISVDLSSFNVGDICKVEGLLMMDYDEGGGSGYPEYYFDISDTFTWTGSTYSTKIPERTNTRVNIDMAVTSTYISFIYFDGAYDDVGMYHYYYETGSDAIRISKVTPAYDGLSSVTVNAIPAAAGVSF